MQPAGRYGDRRGLLRPALRRGRGTLHPVELLEDRRLLSGVTPAAQDPLARAADAAIVSLNWQGRQAQARKGEFILSLDAGGKLPADQVANIARRVRAKRGDVRVGRHLGAKGTVLLQAPDDVSAADLQKSFRKIKGFHYVEPNFVYHADVLPNDPRFGEQFGLNNTGQSGGTPDDDIDAPEAWELTRGDPSVVVGVIDSGVKYDHPDLAANMWHNPGEIPGNGVDDDADGFIDDYYGYDFLGAGDSDPMDVHGHGTHVSGTVAAVGDNGVGVTGVSWNAKIMALRFLDASGNGDTADAIEAIDYAVMQKNRGVNLRVLNCSWGGPDSSSALRDAVGRASGAGILVVCAAGNNNLNNDQAPYYPASYDLPNVIAVAATDRNDQRAPFSNYGAVGVDLGAPGVGVVSTAMTNGTVISDPSGYRAVDGTSMASPHVAGVAALGWSLSPTATVAQMRDALLNGGDAVPALAGITATGRRLNALGTLQRLGLTVASTTPAAGTTLTAQPVDFVVRFSDPVVADAGQAGGVQPGDLLVNGRPADSVALSAGNTVATFHYVGTPVVTEGLQTMRMALGAVRRAGDNDPVKPLSADFRYDLSQMRVAAADPAPGATVVVPMTKLRLDFNEPYDPSSIGASDLTLSQGSVTGFTLVDADTVEYALAGLTAEAALTVSLAAGAVADRFTNPIAAFVAQYNLDRATATYPGTFAPAAPTGSLAAWNGLAALPLAAATGLLGAADDADDFLLPLDSGQGFSVFAAPSAPTLRLTVAAYDELGHLLGSATAPAAGQEAVLQGVPAVDGGAYRIRVTGTGSIGVGYTVRAVLNATEDLEQHGGSSNNNISLAQDLDPAFVALPLGGAGARQATVLGLANGEDDYFGFTLAAGQAISLSATPRGVGSIDALEVYGGVSGAAPLAVGLATGQVGPAALNDRVVDRFVAPAAGRYYARVSGYGSYDGTPYELVATTGAAIDREPDDSLATARPLSGLPAAVGSVGVRAGAIDMEQELNDDTSPGGGPNDLPFANDLTASFTRLAPGSDDFGAAVRGTVSFGNDFDWDFFRIRATPGDALSVRMTMPTANAYLRLFDNRGVEIAADDNGGGGTDALLRFGAFTYAGDYYVVADTADGTLGDYTLNATLMTTSPPGGAGDDDYYQVNVNAGDVLTLRTATPGGDSGAPADNGLDPRIELYGPGPGPGSPTVLLAFDDNGALDRRNALLTYAAATAGPYYVRVLATNGTAGRYVLGVSGATGSAAPPPLVVAATNPVNGAVVGPPLREVRVDFSGAVTTAGLNPASFTVDGRPATGYSAIDGDTVSFFLPALASGTHQLALAAGAVRSISGVPLTAYSGQFTLDAQGPRVVASSIQQGDTVPAGTLVYSARFDEPVRADQLSADWFRLTGAITGQRTPASFNYDALTRTLTVRYTGLGDDAYTLSLLSGDAWIEDALGNDLDGEAAWPLPAGGSGDGTPGGSFSVRFFADGADGRAPPAFQARSPVGSQVYDVTTQAALGGPADADEFNVALGAGQIVQLAADPAAAPGLRPAVELIDPAGASLGSVTAPAAGRAALLLARTTTAGTYRVRVSAAAGGTGAGGVVNLRVLLGAAAEAETYGGSANGSRGAAQNIDAAFAMLPGAAAAASGAARGAVLGSLAPASVLRTIAADDFESGALGAAWTTWSSDAAGRVRVTGPAGANGGAGALWMDRAESSAYSLNEAVWTVDLRGASNPVLSFDYADYGDERDAPNSAPHSNGDGVLISTDGQFWVPVWVPQFNTLEGAWGSASVNLAAAAASAGLSLNAVVRIKFQQYDDSPMTADGRGWDNVAVKAAAPGADGEDWYAFTATAADQPFAVVLASLQGTGSAPPSLAVQLFGEAGAALASGTAGAANVTQAIADFVAPAAGTYYLRVAGAGADYALAVLRSAAFDLEPNDSAAAAQDLAGRGSAAGYLGIPSAGLGAGSAASPAPVALPTSLTDGAGYNWSVIGDGSISDGSFDAYDGALIHVGFPYVGVGTAEDAGREIAIGPATRSFGGAGTFRVMRKVYVPRDQGYARFLEVVTNTGAAAADYQVAIQSDLGSDGQETVVGTSSGDGVFSTADDWIVTDDADAAGDPTLLHVIAGPGAAVRPSDVSQPPGALNYAWDLHLAPGETRIIMHFASQNPDRATALARGAVLRQLGAGALEGMSDAELRQVANFALANPRDYYARAFAAGQLVSLQTFTPGDAPGGGGGGGGPDNTLDARLEVYDPAGQLVASDDDSAPDGRNARLAFVAGTSGTYTVVVSAAGDGDRGEYVLDLAATSPAPGAPGRPDLSTLSDTGISIGDDVTTRNNSAVARRLIFLVPGTAAGALVTLYADGHLVGSATAAGETTTVTTNGTFALADGDHVFTARQTRPGQAETGDSLALRVTVDTAAPAGPAAAPDLRAADDGGAGNDDDLTNVTRPTLDVPAPGPGLYYRLYDNGALVSGFYDTAPSFTPAAPLADGAHRYTLRSVDAAGNESPDGPALTVTVDTAAPRVAEVLLAGSAWTPAFLAYLRAAGLGTGGYRVPAGAAQLKALPWTNLDQVKVRFSEPLPLAQAQLLVNGTALAQYAVASFAYDAAAGVGTWTLARPVRDEKLLLSLAGGVADAAGNALDGDWADAAQAFPSGDGMPGGGFGLRLNVLPGDGNQDGAVSGADAVQVRSRLTRTTANPGSGSSAYSPLYDLDGNGRIDTFDYSAALSRMSDQLPAGEPAGASSSSPGTLASSSPRPSPTPFATRRIALAGTDAQSADELKAALA